MDPQPVYWDDERPDPNDPYWATSLVVVRTRKHGKLVAVLPMPPIGFVGVVMTSVGFDIVPLDKLRPGYPS